MKKIIIFTIILVSSNLFSDNFALIIGNSEYSQKLGKLKNPVNDAIDLSSTLNDLDFEVTTILNGNRKDIVKSIRDFKNKLNNEDTALFYYAGHGVQIYGKNYLIPIGADLEYESDAEFEAIEMDFVLSELEKSSSQRNIIFFDACRNNELKKDERSNKRGLAITQRRLPESIIIYSTSPGEIANDGYGRNSPFAESLIKNITSDNLSLTSLIMKISKEVQDITNGQIPWRSSSLTEEFFFTSNKSITKEEKNMSNEVLDDKYGYIDVSVNKPGNLYLNGKLIKKFPSSGTTKISNVLLGDHTLEFKSINYIDKKQIKIIKDDVVKVLFDSKLNENVHNSNKIEMILITNGFYTMGSDIGPQNEKPPHTVIIDKDFYIGKYEVTQKQWVSVMQFNPSKFKGENLPVDSVSWNDAIKFCNELSKNEGYSQYYIFENDKVIINKNSNGYRLPNEIEWEFAARGGNFNNGYIFSGSDNVEKVSWHEKTTNNLGTMNVGSKEPNELGLYDMSGNVWEWCNNWYYNYPNNKNKSSNKVVRGGSWFSGANGTRVSIRSSFKPSYKFNNIGFRVCRTVN